MKRAIALPTLVTLAAATWLLLANRRGEPDGSMADQPTSAAPEHGFRFRWPGGNEWIYDLTASDSTTGVLAPGQVDAPLGRTDLALTLALRSHGEREGGYLLGLQILELRRHRLEALGNDVLPDAKTAAQQLLGHEAFALVGADGRLQWLRTHPRAPALFTQTVQWILNETAFHLPSIGGGGLTNWESAQAVALGEAVIAYEARGAPPLTYSRRKRTFRRLRFLDAQLASNAAVESRGEASLTRAGQLHSLAELTHVRTSGAIHVNSQFSLSLILKSSHQFEAVPSSTEAIAAWKAWRSTDLVVPTDVAAQMLVQRIGDMTWSRLRDDLRRFGPGGQMPNHNRWFWQASGLLMRDPAACGKLAKLFHALDTTGRALVFDLLAAAGHAEAQRTMRQLAGPGAHSGTDREGAVLRQRFALVQEPDPETLAFAAQAHQRALGNEDREVAVSDLLVKAAVAGRLLRDGDATARTENERLIGQLQAAQSAEERVLALAALGNVGHEGNVDAVAALAHDPNPDVRTATARALRATPGPSAQRVLNQLASDHDSSVKAAAITILKRFEEMQRPTSINPSGFGTSSGLGVLDR